MQTIQVNSDALEALQMHSDARLAANEIGHDTFEIEVSDRNLKRLRDVMLEGETLSEAIVRVSVAAKMKEGE